MFGGGHPKETENFPPPAASHTGTRKEEHQLVLDLSFAICTGQRDTRPRYGRDICPTDASIRPCTLESAELATTCTLATEQRKCAPPQNAAN